MVACSNQSLGDRLHTGIPQLHALIQSLQKIAKDSGQTRPLLIGIDQENGKHNTIFFRVFTILNT